MKKAKLPAPAPVTASFLFAHKVAVEDATLTGVKD
jgi:hypothetical protein